MTGLIVVPCLVELLLIGADFGLWGTTLWRPMAYQYGGFWAGLLHDWQPNFALQPVTMFLTYSQLHAGLGHLVGNMVVLAWLGGRVADRQGERMLLLIYAVSALVGALVFGLISNSPAPMVGASGAIFGLAGALTVWDAQSRHGRARWVRAARIVLALVLVNLVMWWLQSGNLAWQTHLGGTLAGMAVALYPALFAKIRA
ncbi:MAG: rhomboid family intramembrane serine protease [Candidatus Saccharibacteria bacterium]|nr:rhomboid family intramembrane serine protease [Pseudorhodobacter sp.]